MYIATIRLPRQPDDHSEFPPMLYMEQATFAYAQDWLRRTLPIVVHDGLLTIEEEGAAFYFWTHVTPGQPLPERFHWNISTYRAPA